MQCILINVTDEQSSYIQERVTEMVGQGFRVESDLRNESMGYKIRDAIARKVPYIGVIGQKELEQGDVSVRKRGEKKSEVMKLNEFTAMLKNEIENKDD